MPAREGEQLGVDLSLGGGSDAAAGPRLPKRARPPGGGGASCAVEGCDADLSGCREYHRRHKVCEAHSKTPVVLVAGQEQRFCQQCSRFHLLPEFDEGKRSCRKRLDGHNRRRRKPQPDPSNFGNFFPLYEGPRFSPSRHMIPTPVLAPSWSSILEDKQSVDRHLQPFQLVERQQDITSRFHIYNEGKQAPCLHDVSVPMSNGVTLLDSALQQQRDISSSKLYIIQDEFSSGATQIVNSDCALSLLSSPTQIPGTHLGNMVSASHTEFRQPIAQSIHQLDDLGRYSESQASASVLPIGLSFSSIDGKMVRTIMDSNGSNILNLRCQDAYNIEDGLSSGHTETLPFSWQ